jgi:cytochrome c-type biogenesis protein CcmE
MMRSKRRATVALALCATALVAIVLLGVTLSENVVYFRTVSEALARKDSDGKSRFRIAGQVVPGTIVEHPHDVSFDITDGKKTVTVAHHGDTPALFKADVPVVCEGRWGSGDAFDSDRILIKHGSDYEPPKVKTGTAQGSAG